MSRWRDVKNGKVTPTKNKNETKEFCDIQDNQIANIPARLKAFAVDMFMIMMPILYIITYVLLDGKDAFQENNIAHWVSTFTYGFVVTIFWYIKGQTPGMKAYEIKVVDKDTQKNLSFAQAFWRYLSFLFSATILIGILLPFFRKDKKALHDIMSNSVVINHK